jgi:hypothetical protein
MLPNGETIYCMLPTGHDGKHRNDWRKIEWSPIRKEQKPMSDDGVVRNATRNRGVVTLGHDSSIQLRARCCAQLKQALINAQMAFDSVQSDLKEYGKQKRDEYNEAFRSNVVTVNVPYISSSGNPQFIQVTCTNRYTIDSVVVLNMEKEMDSDLFERLFTKEVKKVLKPNAEQVLRELLSEFGLKDDALNNAFDSLFDTEIEVSTTSVYEDEIKKAPEEVQKTLAPSVVRVEPSLKFP